MRFALPCRYTRFYLLISMHSNQPRGPLGPVEHVVGKSRAAGAAVVVAEIRNLQRHSDKSAEDPVEEALGVGVVARNLVARKLVLLLLLVDCRRCCRVFLVARRTTVSGVERLDQAEIRYCQKKSVSEAGRLGQV